MGKYKTEKIEQEDNKEEKRKKHDCDGGGGYRQRRLNPNVEFKP
jgi:hypothetical protein